MNDDDTTVATCTLMSVILASAVSTSFTTTLNRSLINLILVDIT